MPSSLGYELEQYHKKNPIVLIDVGSSGGLKANWKSVDTCLTVIGFEPDRRAFDALSTKNSSTQLKYLNTALSEHAGVVDFYLTKKQQLSSVFRSMHKFLDRYPNSDRFDIIEVVKIDVDSMYNQLRSAGINYVDFIKLDTQGSELLILKGAKDFLVDSVFGIETEVEFSQIYEGQPVFADVDSFLRGLGFELFDLAPCYWVRKEWDFSRKTKGQAIFGDVLYLKTGAAFERIIANNSKNGNEKAKIIKAISICLIYKHIDYALQILTSNKCLFSEVEMRKFAECIISQAPRTKGISGAGSKVRGIGRFADAIYLLWKYLMPKYWKSIIYLQDGQRIEKL
jgi:FkbM family methyltransferase